MPAILIDSARAVATNGFADTAVALRKSKAKDLHRGAPAPRRLRCRVARSGELRNLTKKTTFEQGPISIIEPGQHHAHGRWSTAFPVFEIGRGDFGVPLQVRTIKLFRTPHSEAIVRGFYVIYVN